MPPAQGIGVEIVVPQEIASEFAKEKEKGTVQGSPQKGVSVQPSGKGIPDERHKNKGVAGVEDWIVPPAKKTAKVALTRRASTSSALGANSLSADAIDPG